MSIPFHETRMGRSFFEHHIPVIVEALEQVAHELKKLNETLQAKRGEPDDPQA